MHGRDRSGQVAICREREERPRRGKHRGRHEAEGRDDHRDKNERGAGGPCELHGRRRKRRLGRFGGREGTAEDTLGDELDRDVEHTHPTHGERDCPGNGAGRVAHFAAHLQRGFHPKEGKHQEQSGFSEPRERGK